MNRPNDAEYLQLVESLIGPLKVKLQFGTWKDKAEALDEVLTFGKDAAPLVPFILEGYKSREDWVFPFQLVCLLEATGESSIISALRETRAISRLAVSDRLVLFRHGAKDLEDGLLRFLYEHRDDTECWERREVAEAMGACGSEKVVPVLRAILGEISEPLNERTVPHEDEVENPDKLLGLLRHASQVQFRDAMRAAVHRLIDRGVVK